MIYTLTLNPAMDKTILVETFDFNGVNRPINTHITSGGKGFNVSRALMKLGAENCALGFIGGSVGEYIQNDLNHQGIDTKFINLMADTRTNLVIRETSGRYIKINEEGPRIDALAISKLMIQIDTLSQTGDLWVLCGSLPPGSPVDFYQTLIERLHSKGVMVVLDTSGEAFKFGLAAIPDLIKPNQFEAWEVLGEKLPIQEIPTAFHRMGITAVVLSLGEGGLIFSHDGKKVLVSAPSIKVINPVGAGDAALAGALYGIVSGLTVGEIAKWATASGSAAAASEENCFLQKTDVLTLLNNLSVEEL